MEMTELAAGLDAVEMTGRSWAFRPRQLSGWYTIHSFTVVGGDARGGEEV